MSERSAGAVQPLGDKGFEDIIGLSVVPVLHVGGGALFAQVARLVRCAQFASGRYIDRISGDAMPWLETKLDLLDNWCNSCCIDTRLAIPCWRFPFDRTQ